MGVRRLLPREAIDLDDWVERATERADPFMAWLGVLFALIVGYQLAVELTPRVERWLAAVGWTIWAVFVLEFLARLWLAPRKRRFLRRHWLSVLALAVPTLRILRFLRLLRLGRALPATRVLSTSYRSIGTARKLLRSRLGYLGATAVVVAIGVAELAYLFERDQPSGAFETFGDALFWSFATVLALQADPVPESLGARLVMLAGFAFGLVVVASLAGTVGAFLIDDRRERSEATDGGESRDRFD